MEDEKGECEYNVVILVMQPADFHPVCPFAPKSLCPALPSQNSGFLFKCAQPRLMRSRADYVWDKTQFWYIKKNVLIC